MIAVDGGKLPCDSYKRLRMDRRHAAQLWKSDRLGDEKDVCSRRRIEMSTTIESKNKALSGSFDTLFNKRDYLAADAIVP